VSLGELSPLAVETVVQALLANRVLLIGLVEASPESLATLLAGSRQDAAVALLSALIDSKQFDAISTEKLLELASTMAGIGDMTVQSSFDADEFFAALDINTIFQPSPN